MMSLPQGLHGEMSGESMEQQRQRRRKQGGWGEGDAYSVTGGCKRVGLEVVAPAARLECHASLRTAISASLSQAAAHTPLNE